MHVTLITQTLNTLYCGNKQTFQHTLSTHLSLSTLYQCSHGRNTKRGGGDDSDDELEQMYQPVSVVNDDDDEDDYDVDEDDDDDGVGGHEDSDGGDSDIDQVPFLLLVVLHK